MNPGHEIAAKLRNWRAKKILGLLNKRENNKPKHFWIAKTNSNGTPKFYPISCPVICFKSVYYTQFIIENFMVLNFVLLQISADKIIVTKFL